MFIQNVELAQDVTGLSIGIINKLCSMRAGVAILRSGDHAPQGQTSACPGPCPPPWVWASRSTNQLMAVSAVAEQYLRT